MLDGVPPPEELDRLQSSRLEAGLDLILLCDDELAGEGEVRKDAEYVFPVHSTDFPGQALASPDKHFPTAKQVATEAARQAVFQTNELVQNILVHLPARTIFEMQRVSKSFHSAIDNSALIQKKLFRRKREDPETKVMVYGVQHTAALLNPLFVLGASPGDRTAQNMPLVRRETECEKYGVTMVFESRIPMESSILDTYLLHVPFRKIKLSLSLWVGKDGPTVMIDYVDAMAGKGVSIRAMIQSVLDKDQYMSVAYDESMWRVKLDGAYEDPASYVLDPGGSDEHGWNFSCDSRTFWKKREADRTRYIIRHAFHEMMASLSVAKAVGNEKLWGWGCNVYGKPNEVLRDFKKVAGHDSEAYISLSQRPTFWLHDVVIPSPSDWATIEAKSSKGWQ